MVIYGSEWFRREAKTMARKWESLGIIPDDIEPSERSEMALAGLSFWRIPCRRGINGSNEYLLTLAVNGGLPAHVMTSEQSRPVVAYFRNVMAEVLAMSDRSPETLDRIVQLMAHHLPETYRDRVIYELTSELVSELLKCREHLPSGRTLSDPAAMLDETDPEWRSRIPIYLPQETSACSRLFNDLLLVQPRSTGPSVGVERVLERDAGGNWVPGIRVGAEGRVPAPELTRQGESRFRAFFAGSAGRRVSREFAHLYVHVPEGAKDYVVDAKPVRHKHTISPYPFDEPLVVQLIQDGAVPFSMLWPGGRASHGEVHVLAAIRSQESLVLVGTASTRSKFEELFVYTNVRAFVEPDAGASAKLDWSDADHALWRIRGAVVVKLPDGERYRVVSGSSEDDRRLIVGEGFFPGIHFSDRTLTPCYRPVEIKIEENGVQRLPEQGKVECHQAGRPISDIGRAEGIVTLRWRDDDGFLIDSRRLVILPQQASIEGRLSDRGAEIKWAGLRGWTLKRGGAERPAASESGSLTIPPHSGPTACQAIELIAPNDRRIELTVDLRCDRLTLVGPNGNVVAGVPTISMPNLRGMSLRSDKGVEINLQLIGGGMSAHVMRLVEGILPAESLLDLVAMLLGLSRERGPTVMVSSSDGRQLCRVKRPQLQPKIGRTVADGSEEILLSIDFADLGEASTPVARSLIDADREVVLERDDAAGTYRLPSAVVGPALIYARSGDAVSTRPTIVVGAPIPHARRENLLNIQSCALLVPDDLRESAYRGEFRRISGAADARPSIAHLQRTIVSLNGVSPRALDLTRWLPDFPALLCRVLLSSASDEIDIVHDLQRDLPFLWIAQPMDAWRDAIIAEHDSFIKDLAPLFIHGDVRAEAAKDLKRRIDVLGERLPWFSAVKTMAGFPCEPGPGLMVIAQRHVRDHAELRARPASLLVQQAERFGLPDAIRRFDYPTHTTLAAPVVLASIVQGHCEMTPELQWALRTALDTDSIYVEEAFPHCLNP